MLELILASLLALMPAAADRIPVLLITGENNHDWEFTSKAVAEMLERTGRFEVTVTEEPGVTLAKEDLGRYRAFFLDYNGPRWGATAERRFLDAVRGGAGVVVMHAANNAFDGWKEYETLVGHCWRKGTGHGKFHSFDVAVLDRNHPVTAAMPELHAHPDELYHRLVHMHGARHRVLMSARSTKASGGTGKDEPMAIVLRYGKGRVFHTPLGHVWRGAAATRASVRDPQLQLLLARGTEWAATGRCRIEPSAFGLKAPAPRSRAHDPWVFRCVLDGRPRMVVAALDPAMWVAYDAATGILRRAWSGGVALDGAVYTGVHGPQPRARGVPYATTGGGALLVRVVLDGERAERRGRYRGYAVHGETLAIKFDARFGKLHDTVTIEESPEHGAEGGPVLVRRFRVAGLKAGESVDTPLGEPHRQGRWRTKGPVEVRDGRIRLHGSGESSVTVAYDLEGEVR